MCDVCYEETLVVGFLACDTDALAARIGSGVVVHAHVGRVAVVADGAYHLVLHCRCIVDVLHEAGGGVWFRKGREGVEEIIAFVVIGQDIAGYAQAEEGGEGEDAGECVGMHFGVARKTFDCGNVRWCGRFGWVWIRRRRVDYGYDPQKVEG